ncbi:uncharacterized protein N7459_007058 [Penicillium hispanicum]|uniref:uncharacterized protein n=1 Tax=Penicillium hispanicum TaxID=1080232 RepID=UPI002540CC4C|nr:uncharacterized protein N7459_007058 [Penicillium hispanicum]KAJ5578094.1 hypothetical protein N7459_007058 [Penicillium hispanicum]
MRKKNELRRSCNLCRTRKIACSGEQICSSCRERGVECVYDLEGSKGRPRSNAQADAGTSRASSYPVTWYTTPDASPQIPKTVDESDEGRRSLSVAAELDVIYQEHFRDKAPGARDNLFLKRVVEFNRSWARGEGLATSSRGSPSSTDSVVGMNYHGLLTLVTLDLVETVVLKFSRLGVHAFFGSGERYFRTCLLQDETTSMFDTTITAGASMPSTTTPQSSSLDMGPLGEYSSHLMTQLVDVWFTHHPLSILLSKSLLLSDLRINSAKPALLATLLADAHVFTKDPEGGEQAARLLDWAVGQLQHLKTTEPDLTTAQACFLIGWRHACRGEARWAVCYTTYAGRVVTQLKYKLHESPITDQTHINGIDRGAVEVEMISNLLWQTFALTLWSFIQMDISFADLLPSRLMQLLPPANGAESTLLQLDRTMGHITTQHAQTASLQSVWLVAHVSSLVAHLYALYPHPGRELSSTPTPANRWQDQLLLRLNRLMDRERSLAAICVDAREATQDMIDRVKTDAREDPVGPWLLVPYYTISIHLLFPQKEPSSDASISTGTGGSSGDKSVPTSDGHFPASILTNTTLNGLENAMQGLVALFPSVQTAAGSEASRGNAPPAFLHSYVLSLDAVGRAFTHILLAQDRASVLEQQFSRGWFQRLLPGLVKLHSFFDHDVLLRDHRWRLVKRQLKYVCKRLDEMMVTDGGSAPPKSVPQSSALEGFPTYPSMPAPQQTEESVSWSEWPSMHTGQPGSGSMDLSTFDLDVSAPSMEDPLTAMDHPHDNADELHINAAMHLFQNPPSLWDVAQATDPYLPNRLPNVSSPSDFPLTENGKRRANISSFDGTLIGNFSNDGLDPTMPGSHTPSKRPRGSAQ